MEFKYDRDKHKTWDLLIAIRKKALAIHKTFDEQEPEYDPNDNLAFILHLMDLVRFERLGVFTYSRPAPPDPDRGGR